MSEKNVAQPFKGTSADIPPGRLLLRRPACAALIGAITVEWSRLEEDLAFYYTALVNGIRSAFGGTASDTIALESFGLITSLGTKTAILKYAAKRRFENDLADRFAKLLHGCQELGRRRNMIIHGFWAISDEHPGSMIWARQLTQIGNSKVYGPQELDAVLASVEDMRVQLDRLFREEMTPILKAVGDSDIAWLIGAKKI